MRNANGAPSSAVLVVHRAVALSLLLASWLLASAGLAQQYPSRVVRIVTAEAGGGGDFVARVVAQGLTESLKQQVIVDNRSGVQSIEIVSRASADGHTLLVYGSTIWLMPYFRTHVPWDPIKDFAPITIIGSSPNVLAVNQAVPATSVKELVSLAKAKPGDLTYGANFAGATQIATELFKSMADVDIRHIPYKGNGPALNALIAGEVQVMFPNAVTVAPHVKSGRVRVLAVTSPQPSPLTPGVPTVSASGLPGYESVSFHVVMAPARTPRAIVGKLHSETARYLRSPEAGKRLLAAGVEPVGSSPEELAATMKSEMLRLGKVIKAAGIRAE